MNKLLIILMLLSPITNAQDCLKAVNINEVKTFVTGNIVNGVCAINNDT